MLRISGYHFTAQIAALAYSLIYRAFSTRDQQSVLLKLPRDPIPAPEHAARFYHEYELLRRLDLPGIIRCLRLEQVGQRPILVLEDCGAAPLDQQALAGKLELDQFFQVATAITISIDQLHQAHLIHKAITPGNLLYHQATEQVKLMNFSQATRLYREEVAFQSPSLLEGALAYISPEQTGRMNRAVDYRTDLYSLGVVLYELLTGELPFASADPLELVHAHLARLPRAPYQVSPGLPLALSSIIMKLLAKNAEDRYQSATGLMADLLFYQAHLASPDELAVFLPGQRDRAAQFQVPQALYGRTADIDQLVASFQRVTAGTRELLLVAGSSGVGKTALVHELRKPVTARQGLLFGGKFEPNQHIPYMAWIQALTSLIDHLLTESDASLAAWRAALQAALGTNGRLLTELLPNLELIIGPQPPVPALEGYEAQYRMQFTFRSLINVLAQPKHPLAIVLDDLQWADTASLSLLRLLLEEHDRGCLQVVGAYRDNEVAPGHPLLLTLADLRQAGAPVTSLTLAPLSPADMNQLIADTLSCAPDLARPLTTLVAQRTGGNPFYTVQFLHALYDQGLITWHDASRQWQCDLAQVRSFRLSNDAVDFMAEQLQKLPLATLELLTRAACLGNQFDLVTLALASERPAPIVSTDLWPALQAGLVIPTREIYQFCYTPDLGAVPQPELDGTGASYRFLHDQVQQAAALLITEHEQQVIHLRIGRLLLERTPNAQAAQFFAIVYHLNQGSPLLTTLTERQKLARLNLQAGQQARAVAAFEVARGFFVAGLALLGAERWQHDYELALRLSEAAAEAAYLCGDFADMERISAAVLAEARSLVDTVKVYEVQIQALIAQNKFMDAIRIGRQVLQQLGVAIPEQPSQADVGASAQEAQAAWQAKGIATLIDLPQMTDPIWLAAMRLCSSLLPASYICSPALYAVLTFTQVTLSILYGNTAISTHTYACYAHILCGVFGDIATGHQFGQLALDLLHRLEAKEFECKVQSIVYAFVNHWKDPIRDSLAPIRAAHVSGLETGDLQFAGYAAVMYPMFMLYFGIEQGLSELRAETAIFSETIYRTRQMASYQYIQIGRQVLHEFMAGLATPTYLQGEYYDEVTMLPLHLAANDRMGIFFLHSNKLLLNYFFGNYEQALEDAAQAEQYLDAVAGFPYGPLSVVYTSLIHLAAYRNGHGDPDEVQRRVEANQAKVAYWARHAPANWQHSWDLVEAERQSLFGHTWEALEAYERAIAGASAHGFLREAALANELAAGFYLERGKELLAHIHMQAARAGYSRWGATAKVAQLEQRYAHLLSFHPFAQHTASYDSSVSVSLDLDTVIKASYAIAGEIELERLLTRLMRIVIENAGAQYGALILERDGAWAIEAQGQADSQVVSVLQALDLWASDSVSAEIVSFVIHTRTSVVLDDAAHTGDFCQDPYLTRNQVRSVICLPLINQGKLSAVLYLENNLTPCAFTAERLKLLNLLSTQMALALDHARLYRNLEDKVAERTRSLAEAKEAAEMANQAKNIFLASMNHELRSPLNAILGFSALMQREARAGTQPLTPEQQQNLARIQRSGEHLLTLINNILDRSMVEAGRMTITPTTVNLDALLDDVAQMVTLMASEKGLWLRIERAPQLPRFIRTDPVRLRQVLINLLSNAIKFTETGGITICVACRFLETPGSGLDEISFEVVDTGPGLAPEDLPHLFEAFAQRESGRAKAGAGLGLSISREIVRLLGGELTVQSQVGAGASFRFTIPAHTVAEESHPPVVARRVIGLAPGQPCYRLLVVDDDEHNRQLLCQLLRPLGFEVREASNGEEAIAVWQDWQPQLIWMDIRMPVLDGAEATRRIKATPQGKATCVIALTASAFAEDRTQGLTAGCDDILRKPFREADLLALIEQHLSIRFIEIDDTPVSLDYSLPPNDLPSLAAGLAKLPEDLLTRLEQAALGAYMAAVKALLMEIQNYDPTVAQQISKLAEQFEYPRIVQIIQTVRQEARVP